jgi:hypothetical protein
MDNLRTLQIARQREHDEYVAAKTEQGWRDSCDPLRHQISEALEKQVIAERDQQVIAKDRRKMDEDVEEAKYAELVQQNLRDLRAEQAEAREERALKIRRNREVWLSEMRAHQEAEAAQRRAEYEESLVYRSTMESAIREAKEAAEEKERQQAERRKELDVLNKEQLEFKRARKEEEQALDLDYARRAKEELRQLQEDEMVSKLVRVRKTGLNARLLANQLGKIQAANTEADEYIQRAQDEENAKEEERRVKDSEARKKMMLDAVSHRLETMKFHAQQAEERRAQKELERIQMEDELAMKRQLDQEEYEAKRRSVANQYQMLASQCRLKHEIQERNKQEENESVQAMIQNWRDEEAKIQKELAHPHALVGGKFRGHR